MIKNQIDSIDAKQLLEQMRLGLVRPRQPAVEPLDDSPKVLTPEQAAGLRQMQDLCKAMDKMRVQVNTLAVAHDLDLPSLCLVDLADFVYRIDVCVARARRAALRAGVAVEVVSRVGGAV